MCIDLFVHFSFGEDGIKLISFDALFLFLTFRMAICNEDW